MARHQAHLANAIDLVFGMPFHAPSRIGEVVSEMRAAARALAGQIESGLFVGIDPAQRCDLRALTLQLAGWADDVSDETGEGTSP